MDSYMGSLLGFVVLVVAVVIALTWWDSKQPKIEINKSEWFCSQSHTQVSSAPTNQGTIVTSYQVCDQYSRKL